MRGRYRILLGMAAGVGKTYRMLQEGRQAHAEGVDVVIGYLEPHDRPETAALADGLEVVPHLRSSSARPSWRRWTSTRVIRRKPELALVDELAHTNLPEARNRQALRGHRRDPRRRHRRHLDRQHPAPREPQRRGLRAHRRPRARDVPRPHPRRGRRGRARRPGARGAAGAAAERQGLPGGARRHGAHELLPARQPRRAARALAARARRGRRGAPDDDRARPAQPAGGRRADPRARHARAALAADPAPRVPLGAAARLRDRRALGAQAGPEA